MIRIRIAQEIFKKSKNIYESAKVEYENLFGLSDIQKCHDKLNEIETSIMDVSKLRRVRQKDLNENLKQITQIRNLIDKTPRSNDQYIGLILKENDLLQSQDNCEKLLKEDEEKERQLFSLFSSNLRMSYQLEVERRRKHYLLSIAYAVIVAFFGYFFDFFKFKNVKKYIYESSESLKVVNVSMKQSDSRFTNLETKIDNIENYVSLLPTILSDIFHKLPSTKVGSSILESHTVEYQKENDDGYLCYFNNRYVYAIGVAALVIYCSHLN